MNLQRRKAQTRKKLVATASRREGAYNRAGEPSVTFCGEEEQWSGRLIFTLWKSEQAELVSTRQYTDSSNADKAYQDMRCIVMKENAINWDDVSDVITKDQLYRICHISKSTALYLLQSGKIPCEYTGRKRVGKRAATKSKRRMSLPIWKTARCSPKATPPRQAGTRVIILSRWRKRFPKSCWSICGCIIPSCFSAIPMCWPPKRFPKLPATEKPPSTTGAIRDTSSLSGKTMSTTFRRFVWWSFSALSIFAPSPAKRRDLHTAGGEGGAE